MEIEITHPLYRCKEQILLNTSKKAWQLYIEHINSFNNFSEYYDLERGQQQAQLTKEIEHTFFGSGPETNASTPALKIATKELCHQWQLLKHYIQGAYPKKFHSFKLKNAGKDFYFTAYRFNYEDAQSLIQQSTLFLSNYKLILQLEKNMPESFYDSYTAACDKFQKIYIQYQENKVNSKLLKYKKIEALNKIYKPLMEMLYDAKVIFNEDKALLLKFRFSSMDKEQIHS